MNSSLLNNPFTFFVPTQIRFGAGKLNELKTIAPTFGKRVLLVTRPRKGSLKATYEVVEKLLEEVGLSYTYFDEVIPNPTQEGVEKGIELAVENQVDFVIGIGGGSVLDTAKLIAFLTTPSGAIDWEAALSKYSNPFAVGPSPDSALPFIAVSTTSGTGSHCTQAAVVSDTVKQEKITLFHSGLFPSIAIVDPELMCSVPPTVTAATGFDAFTHAFESFLGGRTSPLTEAMSLEAIRLIFENLPAVLKDPHNTSLRTRLAWADTLAGMCLANGGADLPHPLGEIIGGICPRIAHGETLAMVYPDFLKYKEPLSRDSFKKITNYLGLPDQGGVFSQKVLALLAVTELDQSCKRAALSEEEKNQILSHPLLDQLNPTNKSRIHQMMKASLE
ncbi:MAG: iron-containing alcohol dehydrogenase [Flavobacteriaceae bacterium]